MKSTFVIALLLLCMVSPSNSFSQTPNAIQVGRSDTLHSKILNEDRPIQIYLPQNYTGTQQHYPVMYLCDGQWNFLHTLGIVDFMAGNGRIPHLILVSIPHHNRDMDLVPKTMRSDNTSGNADGFQEFIARELMPYVESKFRTQPFRILTGISYGGLFTNYTLITRPEMFEAYISVDPSLWWDQYRLLSQSQEYFKKLDSFNKILYFTQSEIQEMGSDRFAQMLYREAPRGLKWQFKHMRQETHGSITHRSIYDGLEFIFSDWSAETVAMNPKNAIFLQGDTLQVELSYRKAAAIHYTLNGDEPTLASPTYENKLVITQACVLKAKPFFDYGIIGNCDSARFDIAKLQLAEKPAKNLKKGLTCQFYEGDWDKLPDFNKLTPKTTVVSDSIGLACSSVEDKFGLVFDGFIQVAQEGIYTFYLRSDDGSRLKIGDQDLIDIDGLHGVIEGARQILLEKGLHKIKVVFFEKGGGQFLELSYEGPALKRQVIPAGVFFHK